MQVNIKLIYALFSHAFINRLTVANAQQLKRNRMFTFCSRRVCSRFVPGDPTQPSYIYLYV